MFYRTREGDYINLGLAHSIKVNSDSDNIYILIRIGERGYSEVLETFKAKDAHTANEFMNELESRIGKCLRYESLMGMPSNAMYYIFEE